MLSLPCGSFFLIRHVLQDQKCINEPEPLPTCSDQLLSERQQPNTWCTPQTGVALHQREVSNPTSGYTSTQTDGIAEASRPPTTQPEIDHEQPVRSPHGIAERPEQH